jgi:Tfp pilus assembly protein PilO
MQSYNKISLKYKILTINCLLLLGLFCVIYFIILPSLKEINRIKTSINQERIDLEEKYQKSQGLKKLTTNLKTIEGKVEHIDQVFISENRELEFITALEQIADKNNVTQKITLGKVQAVTVDKFYKKFPLQIQAQGTYINLIDYLQDLETLTYYINIKSIELSGGGGGIARPNSADGSDSDVKISANIIADSYWR